MTRHQRTDTERERFAAMLVAGVPVTEAAETIGISRATAQRWKHDPDIVEALAEYRSELRSSSSVRLTSLASVALVRAEQLLTDPETPPAIVVRLIALLLAESRTFVETIELVERLDRLEHLAGVGRDET